MSSRRLNYTAVDLTGDGLGEAFRDPPGAESFSARGRSRMKPDRGYLNM